MLQFLSPLGLLALFALVAPIVIHLLSRRPGKTVKVGSLKFLETSESRQLRSFKLTDVPLLLLRAALLAMLALLLAQPIWKKSSHQTESQTRGWVLIAPEILRVTPDSPTTQLVDSLAVAGNALHLLATDFPAVQSLSESVVRAADSAQNYWSLLRELDVQLSVDVPLWIFAPNRLASFRGERPAVQRPTHWFSMPAPLENRDARLTASVPADSTTALILHDANREEDAKYVRTALETVVEFGRLSIVIQSHFIHENIAASKNTKWVFWLAAQPVPEVLPQVESTLTGRLERPVCTPVTEGLLPEILLQQIASGLCLISDAGAGKYTSIDSRMIMADQHMEIFPRLQRRVAAVNNGVALWTDGFGTPLLEGERLGKGWHYRFHSRFHPAWNDLVLSAAFPQWLHALLSPPESNSDQRRISAVQARPNTRIVTAGQALPFTTASLHVPFWLLAVILFAVERWLAGKKARS